MKIIVLCDEGNNRSVTVAHHLKYWGHDVLSAGIERNRLVTLGMLCEWADRVILTERSQLETLNVFFHGVAMDFSAKYDLWDIGPDNYPRPFNKDLLAIVRKLMEEHKAEYKQA